MGRKRTKEPYSIPDSILNVLNEHCLGAWAVFTFDDKQNSRIYMNADDAFAMKALKSDIVNWSNAMQHIEAQSTLHGILGHNGEDDGEDMEGN